MAEVQSAPRGGAGEVRVKVITDKNIGSSVRGSRTPKGRIVDPSRLPFAVR